MIDSDGFRLNVGIVICNPKGQLLWAKRIGQSSWQFPQGGIKENESAEDALYRELEEEVGLEQQHVCLLHQTEDWLHYRLPENYIRRHKDPLCIGQKQKWFLYRFIGRDALVNIATIHPEFGAWRWIEADEMIGSIVPFKRAVYEAVVAQFRAHLA